MPFTSTNNYQKTGSQEYENKEHLDFKTILWDALSKMEKSLIANDMITLANSLQAIEVLLTCKITDEYKKEYSALEIKYNADSVFVGNNVQSRNVLTYNKLLSWSRIIMKLVQKSG
jgi:hypothetical protein